MNIEVSPRFKQQTTKAVVAIVLFIVVYLLLVLLSVGLTLLMAGSGLFLIYLKPMIVTFAVGIGLASAGFFIMAFLFKFIVKEHTTDISHFTPITQADEPRLFAFIEAIATEVETDFPKNVYLSTEVNASVFYDSNFWSMFLPIRKNLHIGLGLVHSITEQEFKAILAHEFGHFSQRSMKVGSYVYNVNQVIFNLLYDNDNFDEAMDNWARQSNYFSIAVMFAQSIIKGIQYILRKMYDYVNLRYMALSREMEFHADEVAANVAGYLPLKTSLLRMNLASHSYGAVLNFYGEKIPENIRSKNIFEEQKAVMRFLAQASKLPVEHQLPVVTELDLSQYNKSKLNIENQWASHPSVEQRVARLESLGIVKPNPNNNPATDLFDHLETLQQQLTDKLFANVEYAAPPAHLETDEFATAYAEGYQNDTFDNCYNSYYDNKNPIVFDLNNVPVAPNEATFDDLFGKEKVDMVYEHNAIEQDMDALERIYNHPSDIKTFDYDGQKYTASDALALREKLEKDLEQLKTNIAANDVAIYAYFHQRATEQQQVATLKAKYEHLFQLNEAFQMRFEQHQKLASDLDFTTVTTPFVQIETNFRNIALLEVTLKKDIPVLLTQISNPTIVTDEMRHNFEQYLSKDWVYFANKKYDESALNIFSTALGDYRMLTSASYFWAKKDLLAFQKTLLDAA